MFCVECGTEVGEALTSNGLCHACFLAKNQFTAVPQYVDLEVCVHCRARKRGELWMDPREGGLRIELVVEDAVREAVQVERRAGVAGVQVLLEQEDPRNFTATVTTTGTAEGIPFEETRSARARIKNATCTRCSRMQGNYYESIVQIRADNRDILPDEMREVRAAASRVIDKIVDAGDRNAFVLKDEEIHGGLDVYVATNNAGRQMAKAIATEMGGRVREHPKIAGQKDGNDIYRMTYAVRLAEYRVGDIVVVAEEPLLVARMTPKTVTLKRLGGGHTRNVEHQDLERARVLPRREAREAVVVTRQDGEMQVLDPWTYATVPVLTPEGVPESADSVLVLKYEGELIPLPPTA